jgi:pyrimidine operon attenuation protein/uracil phosphoribosyltransferase
MGGSTEVLNHKQVEDRIKRIAWQIFEEFNAEKEVILAGIADRGYHLAERLCSHLQSIADIEVKLCKLSFDKEDPLKSDYTLEPEVNLKANNVVVVDDVLKSGGTLIYGVRYFLNYEVGNLKTVVLVDRNHKRFPVKADFKGLSLSTSMHEHVSVSIVEAPYSVTVS